MTTKAIPIHAHAVTILGRIEEVVARLNVAALRHCDHDDVLAFAARLQASRASRSPICRHPKSPASSRRAPCISVLRGKTLFAR